VAGDKGFRATRKKVKLMLVHNCPSSPRTDANERTKRPMKIEKSIAYQVLANGDIGGEVAIHSVACVCIISTRRML